MTLFNSLSFRVYVSSAAKLPGPVPRLRFWPLYLAERTEPSGPWVYPRTNVGMRVRRGHEHTM